MSFLGIDWGNIGKQAFGGLHIAGKTAASAFGFGGAAKQLENLEAGAGILPDWAREDGGGQKDPEGSPADSMPSGPSGSPPRALETLVLRPDYVVIVRRRGSPVVLQGAARVAVHGGHRFDGNGYVPGDNRTFSFGVEKPSTVDVLRSGKRVRYADVKQVLFCGGTEAGQMVGWSWKDTLAAFFTGGASIPWSAAQRERKSGGGRPGYEAAKPSDYAVSRLEMAKQRLAEAQARLAAVRGGHSVTGSMDMDNNTDLDTLSRVVLGEIDDDDAATEGNDMFTEGTYWPELIGSDGRAPRFFGEFSDDEDYVPGDTVRYGGQIWKAGGRIGEVAPPSRLRGEHDDAVRYAPGDCCAYEGRYWCVDGGQAVAGCDYLLGTDVLIDHVIGAGKPKKTLKKAIKDAHAAGQKAKAASGKAKVALQKRPAGLRGAVLGVVLTAAQKKAVGKHQDAAQKSGMAADKLVKAAARAAGAHKSAAGASKKGAKVAVNRIGKAVAFAKKSGAGSKKTSVRGDELLGMDDDLLGQAMHELFGLLDPSGDGGGGDVDPSAVVSEEGTGPETGGKKGIGKDVERTAWAHVPADAFVYDGSQGMPDQAFGSWAHFYDPFLNGYEIHNDGWWRKKDKSPDSDYVRPQPNEVGSGLAAVSMAGGFGPLIGNPNHEWARGLKWANADEKWFWLAADAPSFATQEKDGMIALLKQQEDEANAAAAATEQAIKDKAAADEAAAKAKIDADNALAQQQADVAQQLEQKKQDTASIQTTREAAEAQARLELDKARAEMEQAVEQDKFEREMTRLHTEMAQKDQEAQRQQAQRGGGGYGGGGEYDPSQDPNLVPEEGGSSSETMEDLYAALPPEDE